MDGEGASLEMEEREDVRSSPSISAAFGPEWQPVVHHGPVYPEGRLGFVLAVSGLARVFLQLYLHCVLVFLLINTTMLSQKGQSLILQFSVEAKAIQGSLSECTKCRMPISVLPSSILNIHFSDVVTTMNDMSTQLAFAYKNPLLFTYTAKFHHSNHLVQDYIHLDKQNVMV